MDDFAPAAIPPFDSAAGIILRQVENGGWVIKAAAGHPSFESPVIAAYGSTVELMKALEITPWPTMPRPFLPPPRRAAD
jgi:hypothetical protein